MVESGAVMIDVRVVSSLILSVVIKAVASVVAILVVQD